MGEIMGSGQDMFGFFGAIAIMFLVGRSMLRGIQRGDMRRDFERVEEDEEDDEWDDYEPRKTRRRHARHSRYH